MIDNDWRNARIEEVAKAMANAPHAASWDAHSDDEREWYRKDAAIALAVFEKAHTPIDDFPHGHPDALPLWERPEAIEAARLAYQEAYDADYDAEDCITAALRAAGGVR